MPSFKPWAAPCTGKRGAFGAQLCSGCPRGMDGAAGAPQAVPGGAAHWHLAISAAGCAVGLAGRGHDGSVRGEQKQCNPAEEAAQGPAQQVVLDGPTGRAQPGTTRRARSEATGHAQGRPCRGLAAGPLSAWYLCTGVTDVYCCCCCCRRPQAGAGVAAQRGAHQVLRAECGWRRKGGAHGERQAQLRWAAIARLGWCLGAWWWWWCGWVGYAARFCGVLRSDAHGERQAQFRWGFAVQWLERARLRLCSGWALRWVGDRVSGGAGLWVGMQERRPRHAGVLW